MTLLRKLGLLATGLVLLLLLLMSQSNADLRTDILTTDLEHPWAVAFLPTGEFLVTERGGKIKRLSANGVVLASLSGLPVIDVGGQGGLFDLVLDPAFTQNERVFISWAGPNPDGAGNATFLGSATLNGNALENLRVLFTATPYVATRKHFGARIAVTSTGQLFFTVGDRGQRQRAQTSDDHNGAVIRINIDGSIPQDNPFKDENGAATAVYSIGHRNPQGAALHPRSGILWTHEHGPRGGDELNIIQAGENYGWPAATLGREYSGPAIGQPHIDGMMDSIHHWIPSIGPSGMSFYSHARYPEWTSSLFVGAMALRHLVRLELNGDRVVREEKLLEDMGWRIRDVRQGPDGYLYLLTDERRGKLLRLSR